MKDKKPKQIINDFLDDYSALFPINKEIALQEITDLISFCNGKKDNTLTVKNQQLLEQEWYDSLKTEADYSVYDAEFYFVDLIACFICYSRWYLKSIENPNSYEKGTSLFTYLGTVNNIVDLGCGVGYTAAYLKEIWSNANVYGTNLDNTKQFELCKKVSDKYNFKCITDLNYFINIDIDFAFCSEYFEHFERPLEHLNEVLSKIKPKYMFIANSFNTKSIGHFIEYKHFDTIINQKDMSKLFSKYMKENGYIQVKTKVWNNKPTLWKLNV
jgi:ubiquinone/menaquinone biosynthesis C-methylase UbiE